MATKSSENEGLKSRLDQVIEKSNAQKKILKKILNQLNKQNGDNKNSNKDSSDKRK